MKKIPTLFNRVFEGRKIVDITPDITPDCEMAFEYGDATVKVDGSCCAFIRGRFYKRYDAKKGKKPPKDAIPCCAPDPITGHWPHWVPVSNDDPADKWFLKAMENSVDEVCVCIEDRPWDTITFEAVGKHFNGNPYGMDEDVLILHGSNAVWVNRDFDSIKEWLETHEEEGLVFWLDEKPVCKIKRSDFGLEWPVKKD